MSKNVFLSFVHSFWHELLFLLALAGAEFDMPLCWRMMSVRLEGTPAGLRTELWHKGKEVKIPPAESSSEH